MQIDLHGKIAVVTGAAGELGRVISRTLAGCGADVAVHYNTKREGAKALAGEIRAMGRRAVVVSGDIASADAVNAMRDAVVAGLGEAHIIVTNAVAQIQPWQTVLEESVADYEAQFRSCVLQNVLMAKAFVPGMIKKRWGRVIGINTECSMECFPTFSAYAAGKRGMDGVLRVLAREVGEHQITVNQIAPGWMISDRDRATGTEIQPGYAKKVPLGRRGRIRISLTPWRFWLRIWRGLLRERFCR